MVFELKRIIKSLYFKMQRKQIRVYGNADYNTLFEGQNVIGRNSRVGGQIGYGTYIGENCLIVGKIGRFCSIANNATVLIGRHPTRKFVSTSPVFYSTLKQNGTTFVKYSKYDEFIYADEGNKHPVIIGNDVWIGHGVLISSGVTIGDGAIIGANAYVMKDVEPYTIYAGSPATQIRKRFSESQISELMRIRWWDWPETRVKDMCPHFLDIEDFLTEYRKRSSDFKIDQSRGTRS